MIIKNGTIVSGGKSCSLDVRILNDKIVEIGTDLTLDDEVIDASGCFVFPGFIDPHTHFQLDTGSTVSPDDFYSGTKAAVAGGTTTIIDFATAFHGETLVEGLNNWHAMAKDQCSCNYGFHMAITEWNDEIAEQIPLMAKAGVTSFKVYMAYPALMTDNDEIYEILKEVDKINGIVGCHCEIGLMVDEGIKKQKELGNFAPSAHPLSRPGEVEARAVNQFLELAKKAGVVVNIVHLSSKEGLEVIRKARRAGQKVMVETCPHYLVFTDEKYDLDNFEGAKFTMSPPLRKKEDQDALWEAISNKEIDTLATDHCSFNFEGQKTTGREDFTKIPNGIPGVQNRPELIFTYGVCQNKISIEQMSELLSENVAKQFGMYPSKGTIQVGSDADIVVWDPKAEHIITQENQLYQTDYTPFEGLAVKGQAKYVLLNGEQVVENGAVISEKKGRYVVRQ